MELLTTLCIIVFVSLIALTVVYVRLCVNIQFLQDRVSILEFERTMRRVGELRKTGEKK